eukprot:scpid42658/ scgid19179/ Receptor-type tyrosine-protein phosphatase delta
MMRQRKGTELCNMLAVKCIMDASSRKLIDACGTLCSPVPGEPALTLMSTSTSVRVVMISTSTFWRTAQYCVGFGVTSTGDFQSIPAALLPTAVSKCEHKGVFEFQNVQEFVIYSITGWVKNGRGDDGATRLHYITTPQGVPSQAPPNLIVTDITDTSAKLQWNAIPLLERNGVIISYHVNVTAISPLQEVSSRIFTAPTRKGKIAQLKPYTTYEVIISAATRIGTGSFSHPTSFQTQEAVPGPPNVTLNATSTSVTVHITSQSPFWSVAKYCATILPTITGTLQPIPASLLREDKCSSVGSIHFHNLEEYVVYATRSKVQNGQGDHSGETEKSITTFESAPGIPPANLNVTAVTNTSVRLQWDPIPLLDQNGEIQLYNITITSLYPVTEVRDHTVKVPALTAVIDNLQPYTNYTAVVAAATDAGLGNFSRPQSFQTEQAVPSTAPDNLQISYSNSSSLNFRWSPLSLRLLNGEFLTYLVKLTLKEQTILTMNSTEPHISIDNLDYGTSYGIEVAAVSTGGLGAYSQSYNVTTTQEVPGKPSANFTSTSSTITGEVRVEQGRFRVSRFCTEATLTPSGSSRSGQPRLECSPKPTITLKGLQGDAVYTLVVYVNNTDGQIGPLSPIYTAKTLRTDTSTLTLIVGIGSSILGLTVLPLIIIIIRRKRGKKPKYTPEGHGSVLRGAPLIPISKLSTTTAVDICGPAAERETVLTTNAAYGALVAPPSSTSDPNVDFSDGDTQTAKAAAMFEPDYAVIPPSRQPRAIHTPEGEYDPVEGRVVVYEELPIDCMPSETVS